MTLIHLNNMTEQDNYTQHDKIVSLLARHSPQKLNEEQMFVEKEEYLNQYRENNFWVIMPHLFQINSFFNHVSCQTVNKEIKEQQDQARKMLMQTLIDSRRHRTFNNYKSKCVNLGEKYVTTLLKSNIVEIPI